MAQRPAGSTPYASRSDDAKARPAPHDEETAVRAYLRLLVGAPVRASDRVETCEPAFVEVVATWSERTGVDRRTLASIGVPREVLDEAGVRPTPVGDLIRRHYCADPFTVFDLARRSGVSIASVRGVIARDEQSGQLKRVGTTGRKVLYGLGSWRQAKATE
jgi:hypothetical protein